MTELAKLKISKITNKRSAGNYQVSEAATEKFVCQFNPETFTLSKRVGWDSTNVTGKNMSDPTFTGGKAQTMSIKLTFDSTDTGAAVIDKYKVLYTLSKVDSAAADTVTQVSEPPWVMVQWGSYIGFPAVITGLDEEYTLFKPDGTPLRANVTVTLQQVADSDVMPAQNPTSRSEPRRTWVVQQGQRLDWIAHMEYGDSSRWRLIADANGIADPMSLRAGQVLVLPAAGDQGR